jgi:hypothetical protein
MQIADVRVFFGLLYARLATCALVDSPAMQEPPQRASSYHPLSQHVTSQPHTPTIGMQAHTVHETTWSAMNLSPIPRAS